MPSKKRLSIILSHGFRGSHQGLSLTEDCLKDDYDVPNPDIPGSGTAKELNNKTLNGYADWLHDYIQVNKLKKPIIIGHSMGSIIASHFIEKYSDDVASKIILLSPIFRTKLGQANSDVSYFMVRNVVRLLPKEKQKSILASHRISYAISHFFTYDKKQQQRIDDLHYKYSGQFSSIESFIADMRIAMRSQTIIPSHGRTLICIGDHDQLTSCKLVKRKAKKTNADYEIINNVGHLINYETPKEVAEAIKKFINS